MGGGEFGTWNDQSLASHDENDLHRSEAAQAHLAALVDRVAQFEDEDGAEPADADGDGDGAAAGEPIERDGAL